MRAARTTHQPLLPAALPPPLPGIHSNALSELPDDLSRLPYLRVLGLKYNRLACLPPVLCELRQLMVLELAGNEISSLDSAVLRALGPTLKELDLAGNGLVQLPEAVGQLTKLEVRCWGALHSSGWGWGRPSRDAGHMHVCPGRRCVTG